MLSQKIYLNVLNTLLLLFFYTNPFFKYSIRLFDNLHKITIYYHLYFTAGDFINQNIILQTNLHYGIQSQTLTSHRIYSIQECIGCLNRRYTRAGLGNLFTSTCQYFLKIYLM